ncbi:MAG TPA: protein kinase [Terracidiphilus sp.]|jgi:serine/threonine-protein kinase
MAEETGQRVGDYEVLTLLGSGGMGRVYKVRSVISNREEAMKILLPDFASEPELAARFMAEIRTLAGLDHPNITQLRTAFQIQNQFVMVMEFVEGTTLDKLSAQVPLEQVIEYSMQVLSALSYAHGKGVTHRDIKPANIMITSHGVVKLMDFGIAKSTTDLNLTRPGTTMGSIYYMSPEQVRGGTVDGRTDIYSFGVTLYEMLTGRKPFEAETSYSVLNAQLNEAPAPPVQWNPALPPELNDIVLHAMAKDPAHRFQSADEFRNALKALREQKTTPAVAPMLAAIPGQGFAPVAQPVSTGPQPFQQTVLESAMPTAAPNQGFAPVPMAAAPPPAAAKSNRSLWIGLGALAAILALVAAATVLPHFFATHAGQQKSSSTSTGAQTASNTPPASSPAAPVSSAPQPDAATPAAGSPSASSSQLGSNQPSSNLPSGNPPKPSGASTSRTASSSTAGRSSPPQPKPAADTPDGGSGPGISANEPPAPAGASPEEVRHTRDRFMDLDARAETARSGIDQLRRQQQAQGYDMRGDMVAAMNRMNNNLREADRAINEHDLQTAREYMDHANADLQRLEAFLGR